MSSLRFALSCTIFGVLALSPAFAHADPLDDHLSARAEVSVKGGSDRSVLTTEFWAPLVQQSGRVVYTDLRLMGDDDDNREGNLGLGYRQVTDWSDSVLGGHVWIDRRRTEHNATFHQVTVGVESLGNVIDLRANGYIALNDAKVTTTPATGPLGPYLAGSGLFYNTNGSITETPQHGIDAEAGYRLPILQRYTDTIRVYGGGYHFFRENTDSTTGYRIRTEAVINPVLSVGARFQHDGERGSQTFLEATLRFPFSAKKLYQQKGLYARLDESPERDVDIVTGRKVDTGQRQILNTAGTEQRILYVDNSTTNGDGTIEHPFNNLTSAQAALQANDILYVKAGTGTTQGMDTGITISQPNVSLIGSGSPLTIQGITFIGAGAAPVITNTQADGDPLTYEDGNGVFITGSNAFITGITVNKAKGGGIYAQANGSNIHNVTIVNNTILNSANGNGINVRAVASGTVDDVVMSGNYVDNNYGAGLGALADTNGTIGSILISNNYSSNNGAGGNGSAFAVSAKTGGFIDTTIIDNNIATTTKSAGGNGINIGADNNSRYNTVTISNINSSNNLQQGISAFINTGSSINTLNLVNLTTNGNTGGGAGVYIALTGGAAIDTINASNISAANNTTDGVVFNASGVGTRINQITANNITTSNNRDGLRILSQAGASINNADVTNVISSGNSQSGVNVIAQSKGSIGRVGIDSVTTLNNTQNGVFVQSNNPDSAIGLANLSNIIATNNTVNGVLVSAANGNIGLVNLNLITSTNNKASGIYATAGGISKIDAVNITNSIASGNILHGITVTASGTGATITSANIAGNTSNNNTGRGLYLVSSGTNAVISNATVTNNTMSTNGANGIWTEATSAGQIATLLLNNNTTNNNTSRGIVLQSTGVNAYVANATISNNTSSFNKSDGILVYAPTGSHMGSITISGNTASNNTGTSGNGIQVQANGAGSIIDTTTISGNNITNNNAQSGIYISAQSAGVITLATVTNAQANTNGQYGLSVVSSSGTNSVINTLNASNVIANNNALSGVWLTTANTGSINNANLSQITANNNTQNGIFIQQFSTGAALNNVKISSSDTTLNGQNGIYLYNTNLSNSTYLVDLGGGSLASAGLNRSFGNTGKDLVVQYTTGTPVVFAQQNWWGTASGLQASRYTLTNATVNATPFLGTDPRP